ncbi:MAG: CopG family transcriptional regulator [Leptospiraceae bacterium]|nr:CopG family transcriptional regulator [Leptospiraceae bacterium]
MKKKTIYKDAPKDIGLAIKSSKVITDFLPSPENLVLKDDSVRITINLSKQSVDFFKKESKKLGVPYQKMIKNLIDLYAQKFS